MAERQLRVDPIACRAHGICAELVPELIDLDEWGYPVLVESPVPRSVLSDARQAVAACPALALRLTASAVRK
ncbi:ferredoxin [Amycolatopsis dendrobii]|uniref:Ferredoxin n=1 Tax=Amycolatopsis dendrobii TaxID=2760662 RepID=A0A7W3ZFX3_9PSEU|nr:ferredoxin [Amycolatopsis dendrobii]MBB1159537.1 ferredoxin [Amycolatopsis dendrobii]